MRASHTTLKTLAAAVWLTGGTMLLWKGAERMLEAATELGAPTWPLVAGLLGLAVGVLRGRLVFRRAAERNVRRIHALEAPRVWQFFRPGFFAALVVMVGVAVGMSLLAETGTVARVVVGGLDWAIAFSLLVSAGAFARSVRPAPGPAYRADEERRG